MTPPPGIVPPSSGFVPPPYPYDRLAALAEAARAVPGGMIDLSVGTPVDDPPPAAVAALGAGHGLACYPFSAGSAALRRAGRDYLARRFGVQLGEGQLAVCVGTKEFVASTAWYLRLRRPARDVVLGPATAYPTYAMGATLAGCRYVAVPERADGSPDLGAVADEDAARALVLWVNSPSNPTGAVFDLAPVMSWARPRAVPVCSDECYAEFTWGGAPATALTSGPDGVVAVHSLSKRSNFAGARVGFYGGDEELVGYLSEVRKHAGLMVPGPVQEAAVVALGDDAHVERQRQRYRTRMERTAAALRAAGLEASMPGGGFYLWVPAPLPLRAAATAGGKAAGWLLAEALAGGAGMLVSPGELYGDAGADFVRIALVVTDDQVDELVGRLDGLDVVGAAGVPGGSRARGAAR